MTLRSALLPLALVFGTVACDKDNDTDDTDIGSDTDSDTEVEGDPNSIAALAAADGRFSILVEAATIAGLDGALGGPGTYTVFAPTDDAFQALFDATPGVDSIQDLPAASLTGILTYHALATEEFAEDLTDLGGNVDTLSGFTLFVNGTGATGDAITVNQASVIEADIDASNGVIHVIDNVVVPPTMAQAAQFAGLTELSAAIGASSQATQDLFNTSFGAPPITVFAPSNDAFIAVADETAGFTEADFDAVLAYHALDGEVLSTGIPAIGSSLLTNDSDQKVSIVFSTTDGVFANNAEVEVADIKTAGGIIHVVDGVLLPPTIVDLAEYAGLDLLLDTIATADADASAPMIASTLSGEGSFTVFAPDNGAITGAAATIAGLTDAQVGEVLQYHVVAEDDSLLSSDLEAGTLTTVQSEDVTIAIAADGTVSVNTSDVVIADVVATNGVVHIIDGVLVPPSFTP